ncbi:helix-turn-helix transcriptional regulator [Anaeromyxobacter paludicola]|uniref:WYL domain-containing protein n=1 Tax=Anaeromyxobacter paludicola TaxID=2918171 RepID=A0ABN6N934_9BACT|nr:WYL domain-containing protein [Anaeromyxobacter paludicola]BDG08609.1 hypothetical protein AMPC_17220 [Anaeromyxobacter paludicola]
MKLERLRRLLLLIPLARRHGEAGIPVAEALAALELESAEQLYEDIELLCGVGTPDGSPDEFVEVYVENDRIRVVLPQGLTDPPRFTAVEGAALLAALKPLAGAGIGPVESAAQKLSAAMPALQEDELELRLLHRTTAIEVPPPPGFRELLLEAVEKRLVVEVDYFALAEGEAAHKRLEPHAVLLNGGRWYLSAWNPEKSAEHLYRLDRMSAVRVGTRCFGEHKGPPIERYDGLEHLYIPSGAERDVAVRFTGGAAPLALQTWGESAVKSDDGSVSVRVYLAGLNYIASWVLGYGGEAEVMGPAAPREALAKRVAELRGVYSTSQAG